MILASNINMKLEGVLLKCKSCDYEWRYKGKMKVYAICPDCRLPVLIDQSRINGRAAKAK